MENIIIVAVLVIILGLALGYVIKAKKSGGKCIGCPSGASCGKSGCGSCSGCNGQCQKENTPGV